MNPRAIGCIVVGAIVFVAIGIVGLNLASNRVGCPAGLRWQELAYDPQGTPAASPQLEGRGAPVSLGSTFIGLSTREVFGPPGSVPQASGAARPATIALACGDGTFQTYRRSATVPASAQAP